MKNFILKKYTILKYLFAALLLCFLLLTFRIKTTHDYFGLFLVWNLFLAFIPLAIAWYVEAQHRLYKTRLKMIAGAVWILFLPNAPYVITDLIHLTYSAPNWFWYDVITISAFAMLSLYLGFESIRVWRRLYAEILSTHLLNLATAAVLMLCGFGIYLGRVVRFNSWDLLTQPDDLAYTILQFLLNPIEHKWVWIFTGLFGLFLNLGYFGFQMLLTPKTSENATR